LTNPEYSFQDIQVLSLPCILNMKRETSRDSEIQTKKELKSKFRRQPGSLSIISLNNQDKEEALEC